MPRKLDCRILHLMDLPNEIIVQILESLEKSDLKSARLVSRTWTAFAAKLLFDQVYVSPHPENFEVFDAIAQHPLLSQCVKTLRYDAVEFVSTSKREYLKNLWSQSSWYFRHYSGSKSLGTLTLDPEMNAWVSLVTNDAIIVDDYSARGFESFRRIWKKCEAYGFIANGYEKSERCAASQHAQYKNGNFLETLVRGLQNLSNLSCVIIDDDWSLDSQWCPDMKTIFLKRPTGSPLARGWDMSHALPQGWEFKEQIDGAAGVADPYWVITGALLRSQRKILTFRVGEGSTLYSVSPHFFDRSRVKSLSFLGLDIIAFSGLRELKLSIAHRCGEEPPGPFPNLHGLRSLLGSLHQLRVLEIAVPEIADSMTTTYYKFDQVFSQEGQWNQLTSLSLDGFAVNSTDLLTHFTRSAPNLRSLWLGMMDLLTGTWEGAIECMKQSMHLELFEIDYDCEFWDLAGPQFFDEDGQPNRFEVERYVVKNSCRHPCLQSDEPDSAARKYITEDLEPFYKTVLTT